MHPTYVSARVWMIRGDGTAVTGQRGLPVTSGCALVSKS